MNPVYNTGVNFCEPGSFASDPVRRFTMMSCTRTCHFLFAVIFILSNPSLPLANPRNSSVKTGLQSGKNLSPNSAKPLNPAAETALCAGLGVSILTPSVTYPKYVWSVRAMMFLQIFPDGKINGTLKESKYGKHARFL